MNLGHEFFKGIYSENPILRIVLGICPSLAVSSSVENGLGMGAAVIFVLTMSNIMISLIRKAVPGKIRIPIYIVVIATFVTVVEMIMGAYFPPLYKALGIFVPLIVVNCIILGRAEAFAGKNAVIPSIVDALGMGIGFTLSLVIIASIREILGNGTWLNMQVAPDNFEPVLIMMLAPGAFITIGFLVAFMNKIDFMQKAKKKAVEAGFIKTAGGGN